MGWVSTTWSLGHANSYVLKSFRTGDRAALDTAIDLMQQAMAGTKPGHRDYAQCLFLLTNAFRWPSKWASHVHVGA